MVTLLLEKFLNDADSVYRCFFEYCKFQKGLSPNTLNSYFFDLRTYNSFLTDRGLSLREARINDIDEFINYLGKVLKNGRRSIARKIVTLKGFYRYLYRIDEIETDITRKIDSPKFKKSLPRYLLPDQQKRLIEYFDDKPERQAVSKWIKKRDKAIIIVFLDTGLRLSELCDLKIQDLNFGHRFMRVRGKGNREDEIFLPDRTINTLENYIRDVRPHLLRRGCVVRHPDRAKEKYGVRRYREVDHRNVYLGSYPSKSKAEAELYKDLGEDEGYLFVRSGRRKMSTRHIYRILYLAGKALGFRVHPHLLRHAFASNLRRRGADLLLIKEALRHQDIGTTQIYAHISRERYKEEIGRFLNEEGSKIAPTEKRLKLVKGYV